MVRWCIRAFLLSSFILMILSGASLRAEEILVGAGATFPAPLYEKWIELYKDKAGVRVRYEGVGSGKGIKSLVDRDVDFGGTDIFITNEQIQKDSLSVLHIPTCMGAVAITYNLPGVGELRLTQDLLARIFLGKITRWSAKEIVQANPGKKLPDLPIAVVHRSDGSGTNYILTDFLTKASVEWRDEVGCGQKVKWKTGVGVETNGGVLETVKRIPGGIGYVSLNYAEENNMSVASIRNASGNYVAPNSTTVALSVTEDIPADTRAMITNTSSPKGYPISTFTYVVIQKEQAYQNRTKARAVELLKFIRWCIHDGQTATRSLYYAPLPETVVKKADRILSSATYNGDPITK